MMKFSDLPQDILLAIYAYILPQDLLALNQTCRALHNLGTSDYAWHQLKFDLPLDIERKTASGNYRPFHVFRHSLMNALRIERNWTSLSTRIRRLIRIGHGDLLSGVQLLGSDWLITLSRRQTVFATYLSAWHLGGNSGAHCAARIEVAEGSSKFAAAVRREGNSALIALYNNSKTAGGIEIFSLALTADYLSQDALISPLKRIAKLVFSEKGSQDHSPLDHHGMFIDIQVNDNIVAASLAKTSDSGPPLTYQIILFNTDTRAAVILEQGSSEDITSSRFTFKLFCGHVMILFSTLEKGSLYWRGTKNITRASTPSGDAGPPSLGPTTLYIDKLLISDVGFQPQYTSQYFAMTHDVSFTVEALWPTQHVVGVVARCFEELRFLRLAATATDPGVSANQPVSPPISLEFVTSLTVKSGSHVETLCLGRTGRRMVWLEKSWETDEFRLMKTTFFTAENQGKVHTDELIPPHIVLPFQLHRYTTLWFEEATCRICFGLHTGEVYLLEL